MRVIFTLLAAFLAISLATAAWAGSCGCGEKSKCGCEQKHESCGCKSEKKCGGDVQLLPEFGQGTADLPQCCPRAPYTICCEQATFKLLCEEKPCKEKKCEADCGCRKCEPKRCGCGKCPPRRAKDAVIE